MNIWMYTCADPENSIRGCTHGQIQKIPSGGILTFYYYYFFSHQHISQRAVQTSLEKQLDLSPIASGGGSVPVFLRKSIATCDFPGGWGGGPDPLSPPLGRSTVYTYEPSESSTIQSELQGHKK